MAFQFARVVPMLALAALLSTQHPQLQVIGADSSSSSTNTNATTTATVAVGSTDDLIGWFNCSSLTFADVEYTADSLLYARNSDPYAPSYTKTSDDTPKYAQKAQCAQYQAPLCHSGICDDSQDRTIDVFVKRVLAREKPESKPNVWFLQGGSGDATTAMERGMRALYVALDGNVNVYTMDHRGTGRSNPLDCQSVQVTTSGSPLGGDIDVSEFAKCAQELQTKYGDMAAFSITSAATDISTFISKYQSGSKTFVYGVSYGSALVERLMHLDTKEIIGYILDGVSTTSGADVKDGMYMSNWDVNFDEVATRFLDQVKRDNDPVYAYSSSRPSKTADKFGSRSISGMLEKVLKDMDKKPSSKCAKLFTNFFRPAETSTSTSSSSSNGKTTPASYYVRQVLGRLLTNSDYRGYIPVIVYRLERCRKDDRLVLDYFLMRFDNVLTRGQTTEDKSLVSLLEYYLIVFSEMWESPTPDMDTMLARFTDAEISTGPIASYLPLYCAFTKDTSAACTSLVNATALGSGPALAYKKDKYWNVAAKIPTQASVLILSSKLNPETPHKYAERLYKALDGTNKELVTFEYGASASLLNQANSGTMYGSEAFKCGVELLASYMNSTGVLSSLDQGCMSKANHYMSELDADELYGFMLLGTDNDLYDGELYWHYTTKFKTPLIVASVIAGMLVIGFATYQYNEIKVRKARGAAAAAAAAANQADGVVVVAVVQGSPTTNTTSLLLPAADTRV